MKQERVSAGSGRKAVAYVRVASVIPQDMESCTASQETQCREFAAARGYAVEEVFRDVAASGNSTDRPGLQAMMQFLRSRDRDSACVVLVDDMAQLARDMSVFNNIVTAIDETGASLDVANDAFCTRRNDS